MSPGREATRRVKPLAVYMAGFALGILSPVLAITGYLLFSTANLQKQEALHDASNLARYISTLTDIEIQKAVSVGRALAASDTLAEGNFNRFDAYARKAAIALGGFIVSRDLTGQQLTNTAASPGSPLPVSNQDIIAVDQRMFKAREPIISGLTTATLLGKGVVFADVPVFKGATIIAAITVSILPERLAVHFTEGLPEGWIGVLADSTGHIITRSAGQEQYAGTLMAKEFLNAIPTTSQGVWRGKTLEGTPVISTWFRSPISGWIVGVAIPEALLNAPAKGAFTSLTGLMLASLAASLACGWWFSRRISHPIRFLVSQASRFEDNQTLSFSHSPVREVQTMTNALRVASDRISRQANEAMRSAEQIRQNEERLQIIRDMAEIGTMDLDFRTNTQICSPRFYEMFFFPPEAELTRETLLSRVHPGDRERVASEQEQLLTRGGPFESEYRIVDEAGEERWIHARGRLALRDGTPLRLIGGYIDITQRKRNEQALVASEVRFRGTFENAGIGVAHVAFDDRLMLANRGMCVSLGYNEEDLLLRPLKEITFPEDANNDREKRDSTLKGEIESYEVEKRLVRANGSVLWGALTFSLQRDPDSTPSYFIVAVRDITLQRKAQDDLRERLKEIEALYDNTPIGLALVNRHRRFLRVNRAFADMSGFPAMDHVGRGLWEIMPHLKDDLDPAIEQVLTTGQGTEVELSGHTQISPNVKRYWHEKVYPVIGTEGTVKAVGVTVEDVTEDKQAEEHLRFLMRELSHRSKNLLAVIQGMANQTARSVESVEEFRLRFRERLMGLAASHDLLAHRNWLGVSMCKLVYSQLAAFVESDDPRVVVKGPELDLTSGAAEAMGLALHELCTNSVKYGSLRDLNGKVEILWDIVDTTDETDPEDRRFQVNWIEHTPFPITPPGRKGFGWIVIERMAQASLQGKVTMEFPVEGMRWRIDASTACLVPMNSLKPS